jgi:hypothetical protein
MTDPSGLLSAAESAEVSELSEELEASSAVSAATATAIYKMMAGVTLVVAVGAGVTPVLPSPNQLNDVRRRKLPPGGLFVFGNASFPYPVRPKDFGDPLTPPQFVEPDLSAPKGKSAWGDWRKADLTGWVWEIQTPFLPVGLWLIADGKDVDPNSSRLETHHTIMPAAKMPYSVYVGLVDTALATAAKVENKKFK